jgi:Xaa-Pro dipeptidase
MAASAPLARSQRGQGGQQYPVPEVIRKLTPMTGGIQPISPEERRARAAKAQTLMREHKMGALVLESGSSMFYFTGTRGSSGDIAILPAKGDLAWVVPESNAGRSNGDVRTWAEGGNPYQKIAQALKDRNATGAIALEERVRFAVFDGLRRQAPAMELVSGDAVTVGCRVIKSPAEIALMQRANDITIAAYQAALSTLYDGMDQRELSAHIDAAYAALGARGDAMVIFGKYTAFPHGSIQPQKLKEGDLVLVDDGCTVEGYQSDITRTVIFGKPSARQRQVWDLERKAQDAALAAAKVGATCESVDAAARKVITDAGFGPGYKVPGLPHRTGHGIGLDGHEWTYLVKGNMTRLQPGMCFSNEPTISIYGEFGVRLEDCMYITESGARMFTRQSPAIDQPFG